MTTPIRDIEVGGTVLPAAVAVIIRYLIALVGPYLVTSGIVPADQIEGLAVLGVTGATVAYGLWRTIRTRRDLIRARG